MRRLFLVMGAVALFGMSGALLDGGDKAEKKELKKIQGVWRFVAQAVDGKDRPKEDLAKMTITFSLDKWTVRQDDKIVQGGSHKLDPTKKQVDAVVTEGEGKGDTMLGIYELKGDTLKVCFDPKGKERPTSLTAKEGQFSATVERDKKK